MSRPSACFTLLLAIAAGLLGGCGPRKASQPPVKDLSYDSSGHERQKLDLQLPGNPKGAPVVLWVHGGGWVAGNKDNPPIGFLKQRGYVVADIPAFYIVARSSDCWREMKAAGFETLTVPKEALPVDD